MDGRPLKEVTFPEKYVGDPFANSQATPPLASLRYMLCEMRLGGSEEPLPARGAMVVTAPRMAAPVTGGG